MSMMITLAVGFLVGAAVFWFLVLPVKTQEIHRQVNQQITDYSNAIASQEAQVSELKGQVADSNSSTGELEQQANQAQDQSSSYEALLLAYSAMQSENLDEAALQIQNVQTAQLSDSARAVYDLVKEATGVSGIEEDAGEDEQEQQTQQTQEQDVQ